MEDKNELNDIILNKGSSTNSNKKIILAVATLGVVLIVVLMLMSSLNSSGTNNLPQAALPPEPDAQTMPTTKDEPLFEDVEVIQESPSTEDKDLTQIAKKLKEESVSNETVLTKTPVKHKKTVVKKEQTKQKAKIAQKSINGIKYFVQVGSFSKYEPNKKFLKSISDLGYSYEYHKVGTLNKVLVGPFKSSTEAKNARRTLRAKIEPGAFLVKLK